MISTYNYRQLTHIVIFLIFACLFGLRGSIAQGTDGTIEEIIITATKRSTSLQDTPMSVQAFDAAALSEAGVVDITDLRVRVPSLSLIDLGPGNRRYAIRGLQLPGEAQVGLYLDEMPLFGSPSETDDAGGSYPDVSYFDMDRIEVLKGPQGTLYGAGSQGGTVRLITNRPNAEKFEAHAKTDFSDTKNGGFNFNGDVMVNAPIIENKIAARFVYSRKDHDGYIDDIVHFLDDVNDYDSDAYRVLLSFTPSEDLDINFAFNGVDLKAGNSSEYDLATTRATGKPISIEPSATPFADKFRAYNLEIDYSGWAFADVLFSASYATRDVERSLDFTAGSLAFAGSACTLTDLVERTCGEAEINTAFYGPGGGLRGDNSFGREDVDIKTFELRLSDKSDGPLHWLIGAFHQDRDTDRSGQVFLTDERGLPVFGADGVATQGFSPAMLAVIAAPIFGRDNVFTYKQTAVFGELSYDITEKLTATGGFRWFDTEKNNTEDFIYVFDYTPAEGPRGTTTYNESAVIGRFHLGYELSEDVLLYGQVSQGFRPGGPARPIPGRDIPSFEADSLWNYEFGWRTTWADGRATFNGAVFYIDWKDIQVTQQIVVPTGIFTGVSNAGGARIVGVELEATVSPTDNFDLGANFYVNDAEITDDIPGSTTTLAGSGNEGFDGDQIPHVPQMSFAGYGTWHFPIGSSGQGYLTGDVSWTDGQTSLFSSASPDFVETDSYFLANARLGLEWDRWYGGFYVRNLTDELSETTVRTINGVPAKATTTRPRTFGVDFGVRF